MRRAEASVSSIASATSSSGADLPRNGGGAMAMSSTPAGGAASRSMSATEASAGRWSARAGAAHWRNTMSSGHGFAAPLTRADDKTGSGLAMGKRAVNRPDTRAGGGDPKDGGGRRAVARAGPS